MPVMRTYYASAKPRGGTSYQDFKVQANNVKDAGKIIEAACGNPLMMQWRKKPIAWTTGWKPPAWYRG